MPTIGLPRRIEAILGVDVDHVTSEALGRLINARETDDLDAKEAPYGGGDSERRELAADVAAFANAGGGVLVLGFEEQGEVIVARTPFDTTGQELRVQQVIGALVVPPLQVRIVVAPDAATAALGYLLVVVPQSAAAPHAVIKGVDLRYPVRDGAGKRFMSESEVANRYRSRASLAHERRVRAEQVHAEVEPHILDRDQAWLLVSAVPDIAGNLPTSRLGREATRAVVQRSIAAAPLSVLNALIEQITTGFRRYLVGDSELLQSGKARYAVAELHSDGSGAIAVAVGRDWSRQSWQEPISPTAPSTIEDEFAALVCVGALHLLGLHAEHAQARGDLTVTCSIVSDRPTEVGHRRSGWPQRAGGTRSLTTFEKLTHTVSLDDVRNVGAGLIAAAGMVIGDQLAGFGQADPWQLSPAGQVRVRYLTETNRIIEWCERFGVEVTQEVIS